MIFEKISTVPTEDELVDKAFRRASRANAGKKRGGREAALKADESMVLTAGNILTDNLSNIVRRFPSFETIPPFYYELAQILVDVDRMRQSLSRLDWASYKIHDLSREYVQKMRGAPSSPQVRKEAFGRMASVISSIKKDLLYLNEARNKLRKLPDVREEPTIVVAGYPNVGKSSFVAAVTDARPEVASYPFTTKGVTIGHFMRGYNRYQVIDTPGLLDRPMADRNEVEMQAITALKYLDAVVIFILDPSETCGYEMSQQVKLLDDVQNNFGLPVLVAANKLDLCEKNTFKVDIEMSTLSGEGIDEALSLLLERLEE
jgi:nucleolar GTP-binding protein